MASSIDGNRLKQLREENGYTLDEVAKETYNTVYTVQSWEEGWALSNPSSGEISSLAEMFDMSEDDLRDEINADEEYDGLNQVSVTVDAIEDLTDKIFPMGGN